MRESLESPNEEPMVQEKPLDLRSLSLLQIKSKPSLKNISLKLLLKVIRNEGEPSILEKYVAA